MNSNFQSFEEQQNQSQDFQGEQEDIIQQPQDVQKPPQNQGIQYFYVLPHYIGQYWKKAELILKQIADGRQTQIKDIINSIKSLINLHYEQPLMNEIEILQDLINLETELGEYSLKTIFPFMAKLALKVKILFDREGLQLNQRGEGDCQVGLNQEQLACLLANMFFCTTHQQTPVLSKLGQRENFQQLFTEVENINIQRLKLQQIKAILYYFIFLSKNGIDNSQFVTFQRLQLKHHDENQVKRENFWKQSTVQLEKVTIKSLGSIEEEQNAVFVDFSNQFIGGNVLGQGAAQEEILFLIHPELIPSILFFQRLADDQAFLAIGVQQYITYQGYGNSFEIGDVFEDVTEMNALNHQNQYIVGIDAMDFSASQSSIQYNTYFIMRQLVKAYVGFKGSYENIFEDKQQFKIEDKYYIEAEEEEDDQGNKWKISTGQWGCGSYCGDQELQFILQWLVCSIIGREMVFYALENRSQYSFSNILNQLRYLKLTVGDVFKELQEYEQITKNKQVKISLFQYINDFVRN